MVRKIISGGQTGADRAGLDFAIHAGLEHGGYVPRDRKTEDGRIDDRYNLVELSTSSYPARTRRNIEESDGTVIFSLNRRLSGGTKASPSQFGAHGISPFLVCCLSLVVETGRLRFAPKADVIVEVERIEPRLDVLASLAVLPDVFGEAGVSFGITVRAALIEVADLASTSQGPCGVLEFSKSQARISPSPFRQPTPFSRASGSKPRKRSSAPPCSSSKRTDWKT
jgi:hypothetical protein